MVHAVRSSLSMRNRAVFVGFVALNVAFAAALVYFVLRSGGKSSVPPPVTLNALTGATSNGIPILPAPAPAAPSTQAQSGSPASVETNRNSVSNLTASTVASNAFVLPPTIGGKRFGWQDIESTNYAGYLDNLRRVGCPETHIREIVFHDVNDHFNQRRLQAAVTNDFKWWQSEDRMAAGGYNPEFQSEMQNLVLERRELLTRWLGENWEQEDKTPSIVNHTVALTGPVLGALPVEIYMAVQEICARSVSRHQDYMMNRFNEGQPTSQVELAKLRDMTRKDLSVILDRDQLEEFLLRFSHNASKLRMELRGLGLGPDDFRKIFRATDQIDHQIQLEYGGEEALGAKQREQLARQREKAIEGVLGQDRYARLILSRDPVYRQAQMIVMQSGAADSATLPIFELLKSSQVKRQQVQANNDLTSDQKQNALVEINQEQLREQKRLLQKATSNP